MKGSWNTDVKIEIDRSGLSKFKLVETGYNVLRKKIDSRFAILYRSYKKNPLNIIEECEFHFGLYPYEYSPGDGDNCSYICHFPSSKKISDGLLPESFF